MAKSPEAFRTIREVSDWLNTPAHVLRFWESKFSQVKPVKRAGGRRYYRPADMLLIGGIKKLLHGDGMTIKGVNKLLRTDGVRAVQALSQPLDSDLDQAIDADKATPAASEAQTAAPQTPVTPYLQAVPDATAEVPSPPSVTVPEPTEQTPEPAADLPQENVQFHHAKGADAPAAVLPETESSGNTPETTPASADPVKPVPLLADVPEDPADDTVPEGVEPLLALLFESSPAGLARLRPALQNAVARLESLRANQAAG